MSANTQRIVVDTDLGVDDAAAVAWLFTQSEYPLEVVAISGVWGNTRVEHVVANVYALLEALEQPHVPVVAGAPAPLTRRASRVGAIAHGPDGLWGRAPSPHPARSAHELAGFYRSVVREHPGATLLTLGPLTNLALLLRDAPEVLRTFRRIVVLGGAKHHGTMTPVAETNFWHDPEAAREVMAARLPITLVTRDAHQSFLLSPEEIRVLVGAETTAARFLAHPVERYAAVTRRFGEAVTFSDVVAALIAADPSVATRIESALVKVVASDHELTRGQSIIGLTPIERLTMIDSGAALQTLVESVLADPDLDLRSVLARTLASEPDNAHVVLEIDSERVRSSFLRAMARASFGSR